MERHFFSSLSGGFQEDSGQSYCVLGWQQSAAGFETGRFVGSVDQQEKEWLQGLMLILSVFGLKSQ